MLHGVCKKPRVNLYICHQWFCAWRWEIWEHDMWQRPEETEESLSFQMEWYISVFYSGSVMDDDVNDTRYRFLYDISARFKVAFVGLMYFCWCTEFNTTEWPLCKAGLQHICNPHMDTCVNSTQKLKGALKYYPTPLNRPWKNGVVANKMEKREGVGAKCGLT